MTLKREKGNNAQIEEIDNGYILRHNFVEVEDGDYNYREATQYFTDLESALQAIKSFYALPIFNR